MFILIVCLLCHTLVLSIRIHTIKLDGMVVWLYTLIVGFNFNFGEYHEVHRPRWKPKILQQV